MNTSFDKLLSNLNERKEKLKVFSSFNPLISLLIKEKADIVRYDLYEIMKVYSFKKIQHINSQFIENILSNETNCYYKIVDLTYDIISDIKNGNSRSLLNYFKNTSADMINIEVQMINEQVINRCKDLNIPLSLSLINRDLSNQINLHDTIDILRIAENDYISFLFMQYYPSNFIEKISNSLKVKIVSDINSNKIIGHYGMFSDIFNFNKNESNYADFPFLILNGITDFINDKK